MVYTCALNCGFYYVPGGNISFHSFPKEENLRKQWIHWIAANGRKDFNPSSHSRLCSQHFERKCFSYGGLCVIRRLKPKSIPTILCNDDDIAVRVEPAVDNVPREMYTSKTEPPSICDQREIKTEPNIEDAVIVKTDMDSAPNQVTTRKLEPTSRYEGIEIKVEPNPSDITIEGNIEMEIATDRALQGVVIRDESRLESILGFENNEIQGKLNSSTKIVHSVEREAPPSALCQQLNRRRIYNPVHASQCCVDDFDSPTKTLGNWNMAMKEIERLRRKVRSVQQQNRRLTTRNIKLQSLLTHFKSKQIPKEDAIDFLPASPSPSRTTEEISQR